ncbi:undecaprenyl-diphosphatase [Evansella caseinilytica]|uniref:Undecaprenyl-diphosphatase n=1 Tax=Evansella caseinilytica TaxID=1503961 RepID=A0A1H3RVW1_9BACI|nr:phosphatase PAP2 family protein [Evansella caseinilytica]SDZ29826.1 undecaprenyl-diphosphatase [Evansella caseinilytica]
MEKTLLWIQAQDSALFCKINRNKHISVYHQLMSIITHLGGAYFTITFGIAALLLSAGSWKAVSLQSAAALCVSHVIVALLKRKVWRKRPYLIVDQAFVIHNPLEDSSFPSGHTTAIFSLLTPYMLYSPIFLPVLLPVAILVGISRISIGLHYPSDVLIGALIGTTTALAAAAFI